jgi:hypothetical protein
MDDHAHDRLPRLAPLLLAGVLAWLTIARPGNLAGQPIDHLLPTLATVAAVAYIAWRFHGIPAAAAAIVLVRFADPANPSYEATIERGWDAIVLATLALGIGVGSRQGRPNMTAWVILTVVAAGIAFFGWYGADLPASPVDTVAHARMCHVALGLIGLTIVVGFLATKVNWRDGLRLLGVAFVIPAVGVWAAHLHFDKWPPAIAAGEWTTIGTEWQTAFSDGTWRAGTWCWTTAWVAVPLMLVGLWRTIARGQKEWKEGRPPLAWLLTLAGIGAIVALGARPLAAGSLMLAALGSLLSVFGVADVIQAVVERIELKPPDR